MQSDCVLTWVNVVQDTASMIQGVTQRNYRFPNRVADALEFMSEAQATIEGGSCQLPERPAWAAEEVYDWVCPEDDCPEEE